MQQSVTPGRSSICAGATLDAGGSHRVADRSAAHHAQGAATAGDGAAADGASVIDCHVSTPKYTSKGTMCSVARFVVITSAIHTTASVNAKTKKRNDSPAEVTTVNGNRGGSHKRRQPNAISAITAYHSRFQLPIR